jgi:hypothetical protein
MITKVVPNKKKKTSKQQRQKIKVICGGINNGANSYYFNSYANCYKH